jgi:hypothetical protein
VRIALDLDLRASPFLHSTTATKTGFVWGHAHLGRLLHLSALIEIGPRGALFVPFTDQLGGGGELVQTRCAPSGAALCVLEEGLVLPSAWSADAFAFEVGNRLRDPLLAHLAGVADSCRLEGNGAGRVHVAEGGNYTVLPCDVIQGTRVLVYEPHAQTLRVLRQTLGPMGYLVLLVAAVINIYELTPAKKGGQGRYWAGVLSVVGCCALRIKGELRFHRTEDEALFWLSALLALAYIAYNYQRDGEEVAGGLLALSLIATTVYRTHETPYASMLGYALAFVAWGKVFAGARDQLVLVVFASLFCEIALRPQSLDAGAWPITLVFHMFMTFCLAKYQDLSSSSAAATAARLSSA